MVSVSQFEDEYCLFKQNSGSELLNCTKVSLKGIKIPLYQFSNLHANRNDGNEQLTCAEKEQTLLDSLLLALWEECAWKDLVEYDVTNCETKFIHDSRKFIAQLNEDWDSSDFAELADHKFKCGTSDREKILFCMTTGEKAKPELITSATVPSDATLVILNAKPIEYGHVFIVPLSSHRRRLLDARSLEMAAHIALGINSHSFHVFYDYHASSSIGHPFFQACYFPNTLPVELIRFAPVSGNWQEIGVQICEVLDYPINALLFKSKGDLSMMVALVSEICSCLQDQQIPFSLLISECSTKMFLFPQVRKSSEKTFNLFAWECGGYFVFKTREDFDLADEETLAKRLAAASLDIEAFQSVKQISCDIANKLASHLGKS